MKIAYTEIKKEALRCGFNFDFDTISKMPVIGIHHVNDWDHGYKSSMGYNGKRREFYADMRDIASFLYQYMAVKSVNEFIVAPFHRINQFSVSDKNNDIYKEIKRFLNSFGIRYKSGAGVKLSAGENAIIEMILEGCFRGISELCIFFPEIKVLIAPNHHFGIPFFTHDIAKEKGTIQLLLKSSPQLSYYEKLGYIEKCE